MEKDSVEQSIKWLNGEFERLDKRISDLNDMLEDHKHELISGKPFIKKRLEDNY